MIFEEKIIFRPMNSRELNICNKLDIPWVHSAIFGNSFPIFIGDLKNKDKLLKKIEEEEKNIDSV